jgi:hypothetical protein
MKSLEEHMLGTYFSLRIGITIIGIAFIVLLTVGGKFYAGLPLQDSLSAYYHASNGDKSMRDWFVGILFAVGISLYFYKGYSDQENYALNLAGFLAIGVAIFPMEWNCGASCGKYSIHGFCAVLFFLCIAFVSVKCANQTLGLIPIIRIRRRYKRMYRALSIAMLLSPIAAFIVNAIFRQYSAIVLYIEVFGIIAFVSYWITKSFEMKSTSAEQDAVKGKLNDTLPPPSITGAPSMTEVPQRI